MQIILSQRAAFPMRPLEHSWVLSSEWEVKNVSILKKSPQCDSLNFSLGESMATTMLTDKLLYSWNGTTVINLVFLWRFFIFSKLAGRESYIRECLFSSLCACNCYYHLHKFEIKTICFHKIIREESIYIIGNIMSLGFL